jgi:thiamine biosynthesis lipoprotein
MSGLIEISRSFCSMNTRIEAVVCVPEPQSSEAERSLKHVQAIFDTVEIQFSRFRNDSELSRLNHSAGQVFKASLLLYEIVEAAIRSARLTDGIFDPTILPGLIESGYDRSFELIKRSRKKPITNQNPSTHRWQDIFMDPKTHSIYLPEGYCLDLGGIGKGWTVDRASRYLDKYQNYAINAGGDIIVKGTQADGSPWTIGIQDPLNRKPSLGILSLTNDAICTSTTLQRQWWINNVRKHHLIDPRSGLPANSGVISATVIAKTATLAETIAKAALILGLQEGLKFLENQQSVKGLLVLKDGRYMASSAFPINL